MSAFAHSIEPLARTIASVAINSVWQDVAILLAVALLLRLWRNANATTRYAAWLVALTAAAALPIATTLSSNASVSTGGASAVAPATAALLAARFAHRAPGLARPLRGSAVPAPRHIQTPLDRQGQPRTAKLQIALPSDVTLAVAALWLSVAFVLLARLTLGLAKLERIKRNALPLPLEYRDALQHWNTASEARQIRLCVSEQTEVPVAVGLFDSMVLLPRHLLDSLSKEELEQVCLHEFAHLRRADDWTNLLQRIVTAIFWFSPAMYAVARGLDLEREVACDDDVIARVKAVRPYAQCLTRMAEVTVWPHRALEAPGVFVTRRGISERIERLLRAGRNAARGLRIAPVTAAIVLVATVGIAMQAITPIAAAPVVSPRVASIHLPRTASRAASLAYATPAPTATPIVVHTQAVRVHVPAKHVRIPARHIHVPARHIDVPAHEIRVPAVHVNVPAIDVNVPPVDVDIPPVNVDIPAMNFDVPSMRDFRSTSCSSACDFKGVDWSGRDLRGRSYGATDFSDASLEGVDFAGDSFSAVDFSHADLRHADFARASLTYVDFSNARLDGADFDGSHISACDFSGVDLAHVDLSRAKLDTLCRLSLEHQR
jgi:beta-lactamase regulating signal transducer with metallopeptidase domain